MWKCHMLVVVGSTVHLCRRSQYRHPSPWRTFLSLVPVRFFELYFVIVRIYSMYLLFVRDTVYSVISSTSAVKYV